MSKVKWRSKDGAHFLTGRICRLRVHYSRDLKVWFVLVAIGGKTHHEYQVQMGRMREKVLRHARVLFNAIEGKV